MATASWCTSQRVAFICLSTAVAAATSTPKAPIGTEDDPLFIDPVPVSSGVALVIASAGAAIILVQSVIRSWRRVSLGQFRGLLLAKIPLLCIVLSASSIVGAVGAFLLIPSDAKALSGLFPLLGIFAPFVFLARKPFDDNATPPTQTRLLGWIFGSPVNIVILFPAAVLSGLCAWGMIAGRAWDALAVSFSISVAVLTRSDPVLYYSWDGRGPRWQWGRLVPSPVRMPRWRLVVGRGEGTDGSVEVAADAMEVPTVDSLALRGGLFGESPSLSDAALASVMTERGILLAMPLFYNYVETVWVEIIHTVSSGRVKEGRELDGAAASYVLLVLSLLREALVEKQRIGADVWLLLAIFRSRMESIASDYISLSYLQSQNLKDKVRVFCNSILSQFIGRQVGVDIAGTLNNQDVAAFLDGGDGDGGSGSTGIGVDGASEGSAKVLSDVRVDMVEDEARSEEDVQADGPSLERHVLRMFDAMSSSDSPPDTSDSQLYALWTVEVLENLYKGAIDVSKQDWNMVGRQHARTLPSSLEEYLGEDESKYLMEYLQELCSSTAMTSSRSPDTSRRPFVAERDPHGQSHDPSPSEDASMTVAEECTIRLASEEAFSYIMLSAASRDIVPSAFGAPGDVAFESAGIDIAHGDLNGRLAAQSMAHKILLSQFGVWAYVALGQTATALLSST